jgi:hypothetical protein
LVIILIRDTISKEEPNHQITLAEQSSLLLIYLIIVQSQINLIMNDK